MSESVHQLIKPVSVTIILVALVEAGDPVLFTCPTTSPSWPVCIAGATGGCKGPCGCGDPTKHFFAALLTRRLTDCARIPSCLTGFVRLPRLKSTQFSRIDVYSSSSQSLGVSLHLGRQGGVPCCVDSVY